MPNLSATQQELLDVMTRGVGVMLMRGRDSYYFRCDNQKKCTQTIRALLAKGLVEKFAEDWRRAKVRLIQSNGS